MQIIKYIRIIVIIIFINFINSINGEFDHKIKINKYINDNFNIYMRKINKIDNNICDEYYLNLILGS